MMRRASLLFVLLICSIAPALAQKRAFTIEDLYRVKNLSDVHVSPDGRTLVFVVTTSDLARAKRGSRIWAMDADGRNPRQLTIGDVDEYSPNFSPDGRQILFVSAKDGSPNLYLRDAGGGEPRRLTNLSTGVSDPLWSADGRWVAFSSDVYPECNGDDACNKRISSRWEAGPLKAHMADELLYRHWTAWRDGMRTHTFVVNVASGETRDVTPGNVDAPTFQLGGPIQYDFSPDGAELVYVSNRDRVPAASTNNDLWLVSLTDRASAPRNVTASNPAYDGSPKYSPDGRYIAYRMQKLPGYESDIFRIALYERATGKSTVLTESFDNWVDDYHWANDSRAIYFTGPVEGQNPIYKLDINSKAITQILADKTIDAFELDSSERRLVYIKRSVGEPNGDLRRGGGRRQSIASREALVVQRRADERG